MYIPERFEKTILLHVAKNFSVQTASAPLILGIHGPSGEGKTWQCAKILAKHSIISVRISGGELEHKDAGQPAELIRKRYIEAGEKMRKEGNLCVLVINDIDAAIGTWGKLVQTTINTQQICAQLMDLVDNPNKVEEIEVERVPIIVTGNDYTKLYEPLVRAGRMNIFEWIPEFEEKIKMVQSIFPHFTEYEIADFYNELVDYNAWANLNENKNISISFFSHLASQLLDDILWGILSAGSPHEILRRLRNRSTFKISNEQIDINSLKEKGFKLLDSTILVNHLHNLI